MCLYLRKPLISSEHLKIIERPDIEHLISQPNLELLIQFIPGLKKWKENQVRTSTIELNLNLFIIIFYDRI